MHANVARECSLEDDGGVSAYVNDDFGELIANTGRDFNRQRDVRLGDEVISVFTTLVVWLCQFLLPNYSAIAS